MAEYDQYDPEGPGYLAAWKRHAETPASARNEAGWGTPAEARHLVDFHARYGTDPRTRVAEKLRELYAPSMDDPDHDGSLADWMRDADAILALDAERAIGAGIDVPHRDYAGRTCTTGLLHSHERAIGAALDVERLRKAIERCRNRGLSTSLDPYEIATEYARLTPQPGEPSPYAPESYMGGTADMIPVANLTPQPGDDR